MIIWTRYVQARNQLWTPEGRFWEEPSFLNYVQHIFLGRQTFLGGGSGPQPASPLVTGLYMCPITWSSAVRRESQQECRDQTDCPTDREAFALFGQVYLMCLIFVKNFMGKVDLCG